MKRGDGICLPVREVVRIIQGDTESHMSSQSAVKYSEIICWCCVSVVLRKCLCIGDVIGIVLIICQHIPYWYLL